jgi:hypothetical protein
MQHPGVWHSQPVVLKPAVLQFEYPVLQVYVHAVPLHPGVPLSVPHLMPHAPQFAVVIWVSQPSRLGGDVCALQSRYPLLHVYWHA